MYRRSLNVESFFNHIIKLVANYMLASQWSIQIFDVRVVGHRSIKIAIHLWPCSNQNSLKIRNRSLIKLDRTFLWV